MGLDSDIQNADSHLHVEFYYYPDPPYKGDPFLRIQVPGDKTTVIEKPVAEYDKERFPRQWLYFQMQNTDAQVIGTPISEWSNDCPEEITTLRREELQILKFLTVEQVATASDSQLQKVGMGAVGLRDRARAYLLNKNQSNQSSELEDTKKQLAQLQAQMSVLMEKKTAGRPRKEE